MEPKSNLKAVLITLLKFGIVAGALSYLVFGGKLRLGDLAIDGAAAVPYAVAAVALLAAMLCLTMVRYALLLRGVGIRLHKRDIVRYSCIGYFFNTFMLGGHGGDLVKMAYVGRASGRKAGAVASALVDRILGFLAVITLSGVALFLSWEYVLATPALHNLSLVVFGILGSAALCALVSLVSLAKGRASGLVAWVSSAAVLALVAWTTMRGTPLGARTMIIMAGSAGLALLCLLIVPSCQPGGRLEILVSNRIPLGGKLMSLVQAVLAYKDSFRNLAGAFLVSLVLQAFNMFAIFLLGLSLALAVAPELQHVFFAWPAAFVVNAMPVPGGGIGVGEVAFDHLLGLCGYAGGAAMFLAWRCWLIVLGLVGLPLYLTSRERTSLPVADLKPS